MNRRGFLRMMMLAPVAAVVAPASVAIVGIDGGGADDTLGVAVIRVRSEDIARYESRSFEIKDIARFYRIAQPHLRSLETIR